LKFVALPLAGAYAIDLEPHRDERGSFARFWDADEFRTLGLAASFTQSSLSHNPRRGTLRGLHYQLPPQAEAKLVLCVRGSIWDVIVDLRRASETYRLWHAETLDGERLRALYVPEGFAHGYLTLTDDALVLYQISRRHDPARARGVRWDDPALGIEWPAPPVVIASRDRSFADLDATDGDAG
jgi:dTDP-4-dehydrorhamnose 3,5-epimerase